MVKDMNIKKLELKAVQVNSVVNSGVLTQKIEIPLGKKSVPEKLNTNKEIFTVLCNGNEKFVAMSPEEQVVYLKNNSDKLKVKIDEKTELATSKKVVSESNPPKEFNRTNYNKLPTDAKIDVYIYELAKNKFRFGDDAPKTDAEWVALSKSERDAFIAAYKKDFLINNSKNADLYDDTTRKVFLDKAMTIVQASNELEMSTEKFKKWPKGLQQESIYSHLLLRKINDYNSLSSAENIFLMENKLIAESISAIVEAKTGKNPNMCPDQALKYLEDNKINLLDVEYQYLQAKSAKADCTLDKEEQDKLNSLKKFFDCEIGEAAKNKIGTRAGEVSKVIIDIENSKYSDAFKNASDPYDQVVIIDAYVKSITKDTSKSHELLESYMNDALECNDTNLVFALHEMGKHDSEFARHNAESRNEETQIVNAVATENIGVYSGVAAKNMAEMPNKELAKTCLLSTTKSCAEDQMNSIAQVTSKSQFKEVQEATVTNLRNRAKTSEVQTAVNKQIAQNSNIEVRKLAILTTGKLNDDVEIEALSEQLKDKKPELVEIAAEVPSTLAVKNQTQSFKMVKTISETFDAEIAQKIGLKLADQISLSDKSNQLDMHKEIMTSKYQEVQEKASHNIHKYNEDVQSDALKVTYSSGNEKAIQAAESHINEYASKVQVSEINARIVEAAYQKAQSENQEKIPLTGSLSVTEIAKLSPAEKHEYYKLVFTKASPADKIAMLGKLPGSQQKSVYTIICRFCPELLVGMVESGQAKKMLNSGLPIDAVNKIFNIMERSTKVEVINQLKELKGDNSFKAYFAKDTSTEKSAEKKETNSAGFSFFTSTFATSPKITATETKIYEQQRKKMIDIRM